ncbi:aspartate/glutamate racemase family protein [Phenylobacterium sp.]|jgi:aspartate racemase|uniref:aspartate/glutamate racemase family protein n=1 Tax=Phenylobacterium sp. TaxID=1871053 RepID=UPI002F422DB2
MSLILGLLGGMGPAATLVFLEKLQAFTPAKAEQDHIRVIADINPGVPDLSAPGSGAGPVLAEMAGALRGAGADVLAIACNAAHAHADLIQRASGLPLIDMIETASDAACATGVRRVGVLGARGALRLYREYLAAQAMGMVSLPSDRQAVFMEALGRIKAGDLSSPVQAQMAELAADLAAEGAEAVIAGCTEIPLVLRPEEVRIEFIDPVEHLARRCVDVCLGMEAVPQLLGS